MCPGESYTTSSYRIPRRGIEQGYVVVAVRCKYSPFFHNGVLTRRSKARFFFAHTFRNIRSRFGKIIVILIPQKPENDGKQNHDPFRHPLPRRRRAGLVWCSGWRLAAAVSEAGGLGLIGSGSMTPELLREHIRKCRAATSRPFGVNVPLAYRYAPQLMDVITEERVPAVLHLGGHPRDLDRTPARRRLPRGARGVEFEIRAQAAKRVWTPWWPRDSRPGRSQRP